jgi:hypothetical protein
MISAPRTYTCLFDSKNPNWVDNQDQNELFIQSVQNRVNDVVQIRGHVTLNDVRDLLGFPRVTEGQLVGWTKYPIDFGIKINAKSIRLTFSVEGEILDAMKEA